MRLLLLALLLVVSATAAAATAASTPSLHAASTNTGDRLFSRRDADDALLTLTVSDAPAWLRYQALILSRSRVAPLLLFLDCSAGEEISPDSRGHISDEDDELQESSECDAERSTRLEEALGGVARAFAHAGLRVARVSASTLPLLLHYHRVTTQPSLLWLPPRSAKNFQRFPHSETNALDLAAPDKLLEVFQAHQQQQQAQSESQSQQRRQRPAAPTTTEATAGPEQQLTAVLSEVVRQWFIKSGIASARTGVVPALATRTSSESPSPDTLSPVEFVPVVAVLAFLGVVAHNNQELLLQTLRGRFVWFFWSVGVTYAAYSGVFHSLILNMPLFFYNAQYGLLVFHPSGRRQFALEGLFSGAWSVLVSLGAFTIVEILPMERSKAARTELFFYALALIGVSGTLLHLTFLSKTPWLSS